MTDTLALAKHTWFVQETLDVKQPASTLARTP